MVLVELLEGALEMPELFADIAAHDPIAAVLLAVGSVIFVVSFGFFGFLVAGAVAELVIPDSTDTSHP